MEYNSIKLEKIDVKYAFLDVKIDGAMILNSDLLSLLNHPKTPLSPVSTGILEKCKCLTKGGMPQNTPLFALVNNWNRFLLNNWDNPPEGVDATTWASFNTKWSKASELVGSKNSLRATPNACVNIVNFVNRYIGREPLVLGFDTEWDTAPNLDRIPLSYQFSTSIDGIDFDFVFYPKERHIKGLSLGAMLYDIVSTYLRGFGYVLSNHRDHHKTAYFESCNIRLVGHFVGVDLSLTNDYIKLFEYTGLSYKQDKDMRKYKQSLEALYTKLQEISEDDSDELDIVQKDIDILEKRIDKIQSNATHRNNLTVMNKHCMYTSRAPRIINHWIIYRQLFCEFRIEIRDTMLISDGVSGLTTLGESLGIPKLDTETKDLEYGKPKGYYKRHMGELLVAEPEFFYDYAVRDARISYLWYNNFSETFGDAVTTSSAASKYVVNGLRVKGISMPELRGFRMVNGLPDYGCMYESRAILGEFPDRAYFGGRNECFTHGLISDTTYDYDLVSAYLVAMQLIPAIDYNKPLISLSKGYKITLEDFKIPSQLGFGYIHFKFPVNCKYPTIPLKSNKKGLTGTPVFLLEGEGLCSAPDIYAGLNAGAEITVGPQGFHFIDVDKDSYTMHPISEITRELVLKRAEMKSLYGKYSVQQLLYKLLGNSVYGKTGQGLHSKKSRNILSGGMDDIPFSSITDGVIASSITALVRMILGLIMNKVDELGYKVHSVTTDGFISDIPNDKIPLIDKYLNDRVPALKGLISDCYGVFSVLEVKHSQADGFFNIKTRGNIGFDAAGVFAKAGYRGDDTFRHSSKIDQRYNLLQSVVNRKGYVYDKKPTMMSFREIKNCGYKSVERNYENPEKRISMDFDTKRHLVSREYSFVNVSIGEHQFRSDYGYFTTRPFKNMGEYEHYSDVYKNFLQSGYNLKNDDDLLALEYALEHGFPVIRDQIVEKTSSELAKFREAYIKHKIKQFVILLNQYPHLLKSSCKDLINTHKKNDYIEILTSIYGINNVDGIWKNAIRNKNAKFDLKTAWHVEDEIQTYLFIANKIQITP